MRWSPPGWRMRQLSRIQSLGPLGTGGTPSLSTSNPARPGRQSPRDPLSPDEEAAAAAELYAAREATKAATLASKKHGAFEAKEQLKELSSKFKWGTAAEIIAQIQAAAGILAAGPTPLKIHNWGPAPPTIGKQAFDGVLLQNYIGPLLNPDKLSPAACYLVHAVNVTFLNFISTQRDSSFEKAVEHIIEQADVLLNDPGLLQLISGPHPGQLIGDLSPEIFIPLTSQARTWYKEFTPGDWGITDLSGKSFKTPFAKALDNQIKRDSFANWPGIVGAPHLFNGALGTATELGALALGFVLNARDLATCNFNYSLQSGSLNHGYFWQARNFVHPFCTEYKGTAVMRDPGRISVMGTSFTTMPHTFRDTMLFKLLSTAASKWNLKLFIIDLKGAHGAFYSSFLKDNTPLLFGVYKTQGSKLWEAFVSQSPEGFKMSLSDKPLMKIAFYAALNQGFVGDVNSCMDKFVLSIKPPHPLMGRLRSFAECFVRHPFFPEISVIREYWISLKGQMYVPTRVGLQERLLTAPMKGAAARLANWQSEQAALPQGERKTVPPNYVKKGAPLSKNLPSLYFTSLEVICMMSIIGSVCEFNDETMGEPSIAMIQGIHDGFLFAAKPEVDLALLETVVNRKLGALTLDALGLEVKGEFSNASDARFTLTLSGQDDLDEIPFSLNQA